jgi:hypothetical protein
MQLVEAGDTAESASAASAPDAPAAAMPGDYTLHVSKGAKEFTRTVPADTARKLKNDLAAIGAFRWDPAYADGKAEQAGAWSLTIVFQKDVFTFDAKGDKSAPARFDEFLETLYQLDFPRPGQDAADASAAPARAGRPRGRGIEGMRGDGAPTSGVGANPFGDFDAASADRVMQAFASMQQDPQAFMEAIRVEFKSMPAEQQVQLLDMLGNSGIQSRDWWERFLRG